ncbi:MAG: hypothetical protein HQ547_03425 [Candidatus Omnitrophica bacterium]|nr:hypothetical protein [Candidatus Omnitrophota bacterium]
MKYKLIVVILAANLIWQNAAWCYQDTSHSLRALAFRQKEPQGKGELVPKGKGKLVPGVNDYSYGVFMDFDTDTLTIQADRDHSFRIRYPFVPLRLHTTEVHEIRRGVEYRIRDNSPLYHFMVSICEVLQPHIVGGVEDVKEMAYRAVDDQGKEFIEIHGQEFLEIQVFLRSGDIIIEIGNEAPFSVFQSDGEIKLIFNARLAYASRVFDLATRAEALAPDYWERFLVESVQPQKLGDLGGVIHGDLLASI